MYMNFSFSYAHECDECKRFLFLRGVDYWASAGDDSSIIVEVPEASGLVTHLALCFGLGVRFREAMPELPPDYALSKLP